MSDLISVRCTDAFMLQDPFSGEEIEGPEFREVPHTTFIAQRIELEQLEVKPAEKAKVAAKAS